MDRSYLGKVERGEKQLSLDIVFRLSRVLSVTPAIGACNTHCIRSLNFVSERRSSAAAYLRSVALMS